MTLAIYSDGELVAFSPLEAFLEINEILAPEEIEAIQGLSLGESYQGGGGAGETWTVQRIN